MQCVDETGSDDNEISGTTYTHSEFGFSVAYPDGWVMSELDLAGPGMPNEWTVVAAWQNQGS